MNIDDAYDDYKERSETNRENGLRGGRPRKDETNMVQPSPIAFSETQKTESVLKKPEKAEIRSKKET